MNFERKYNLNLPIEVFKQQKKNNYTCLYILKNSFAYNNMHVFFFWIQFDLVISIIMTQNKLKNLNNRKYINL